MWKHEVLADLQRNANNSDEHLAKGVKACVKIIENAIHIHAGNLSGYQSIFHKLNLCHFPNLPYDKLFITYKDDLLLAHEGNQSIKNGLLIEHDSKRTTFCSLIAYNNDTWILNSVGCALPHDRLGMEYFTWWKVSDEVVAGGQFILDNTMACAYALLEVLNCKNVSLAPVDAPEKLNKARIRKGKLPHYRYHILTVDLGKARTLAGTATSKNLGTMPVHLCRGHFKEYTKDRPLFGRITGRFWWQPHARGKVENGIVMKDYKLKV